MSWVLVWRVLPAELEPIDKQFSFGYVWTRQSDATPLVTRIWLRPPLADLAPLGCQVLLFF